MTTPIVKPAHRLSARLPPLYWRPHQARPHTMQHLKPKQAHEFLQSHPDAVLIDVRSEVEFLFVGHPVGAINVAWSEAPDWEINPHFLAQVKAEAGADQQIGRAHV